MSGIVLFCVAVILAVCQGHETGTLGNIAGVRTVNDISELTFLERLHTLLMAKTNPHYQDLPKNVTDHLLTPTPQWQYTWFDYAYLDFGTLVLQSRHWGENFPIAEIHWRYGVSYCYSFFGYTWCVDQAHSWESKDSKFLGTDTIQLTTDWTPKTFVQRYTIGNYTWWSPEAQTVDEDFLKGGTVTCTGAWAKLQNITFLVAGSYSHDETLGLQVDALTIEYQNGNVSIGQNGCVARSMNGSEEVRNGPFMSDFTEFLEYWFEEYRPVFIHSMRTRINCVLSEGKYVPPPPPEEEDEWWYDEECGFEDPYTEHFVKSVAIQMFQMMGAGGHE